MPWCRPIQSHGYIANIAVQMMMRERNEVSFPTHSRVSGASPFLGEDDNETYANITNVDYDFDDEFFKGISSQAKDFVSALLVKNPRFVYICSFLWSSFKEKKRGEERRGHC